MANKHSDIYNPSPRSIHSIDPPRALSVSSHSNFLIQLGKIFKVMVFRLPKNTFASQKKKMKVDTDIFTLAPPQAKFFPRFLSSLLRQREVNLPLRQHFFKKVSLSRKGGEGNYAVSMIKDVAICFTKVKPKMLNTNGKNDEWIFFLTTKKCF